MVNKFKGKRRIPLLECFMKKVELIPYTTCWEWTDSRNSDGYGNIFVNKISKRAHRISYELFVGQIADGKCVLHRCDNPSCVNPDHLFLGSHQENMIDRDKKRRHYHGQTHCRAKLTNKLVLEIRDEYQNAKTSTLKLAKKYNMHHNAIWCLIARKTWKHI